MWWLLGLAVAGVGPADPDEAKLAWSLRQARRAEAEGWLDRWRWRRVEPLPAEGLSVVVDAADGDGAALADRLRDQGWEVEAQAGERVQVFAPWDALGALAAVPEVARVREPWRARPKEVVTEGWDAVMLQDWHGLGVTGSGVRVAVVDVGFVGAEELVGAGEISANTQVDYSRGDAGSSSHGTAVTEIIHDFAPDASFFLLSFSTDVEFGEIVEQLDGVGVDVINGSFGFDNVWHADGTSSLSIYADRAVEAGAIYVAAAGNENDKYRVGALSWGDEAGVVAIDGMSGVWCDTAAGFAEVSFRWSEPFLEAGEDLDLVLLNEDGTECGRSEEVQRGDGWPYELVVADGCDGRVLAVPYASGDANPVGLEGYLYSVYGIDEDARTNREDLTLPGDSFGGVSVGAWYTRTDSLPYYTSRGPTNDGRTKPDVVAPTAVSTASYGRNAFEGTSAAAPHVAGLAALWVEATGGRRPPARFTEWAQAGARDLGATGIDNETGAGLVQADALPEAGCGCATGGGAPLVGALGAVAALARRRRSG